MGPCAKQRVQAVAVLKDGRTFIGENLGLTPQSSCPRVPGEAYAKCITHCSQLGHAEEVLLRQIRMAGLSAGDVQGIHVFGHTGPCDNCHALLVACGLRDITQFYPNIKPGDLDADDHADIVRAYNLYDPSSHSKHVPQS